MNVELDGQATIGRWLTGLGSYWGGELPGREVEARRQALRRFCAQVGETPDQMIETCLVDSGGGHRRAAAPAVRKYWGLIREHARQHGQDDGRFLISFFVYNGVLMQAPGA